MLSFAGTALINPPLVSDEPGALFVYRSVQTDEVLPSRPIWLVRIANVIEVCSSLPGKPYRFRLSMSPPSVPQSLSGPTHLLAFRLLFIFGPLSLQSLRMIAQALRPYGVFPIFPASATVEYNRQPFDEVRRLHLLRILPPLPCNPLLPSFEDIFENTFSISSFLRRCLSTFIRQVPAYEFFRRRKRGRGQRLIVVHRAAKWLAWNRPRGYPLVQEIFRMF